VKPPLELTSIDLTKAYQFGIAEIVLVRAQSLDQQNPQHPHRLNFPTKLRAILPY
jgi:hypothetical protein